MRTGLRQMIQVGAILALAADASFAASYQLSGNARFQIGFRPIPITAQPPPNGPVAAIAGATVNQTTGPDPRAMSFAPGMLSAPGNPQTLPLAALNPNVFQAHTAISVGLPASPAIFQALGRTGPPTATYCPGLGITVCTPGAGLVNGLMRYTRTTSQFGGPAQAMFGGNADLALRVAAGAPCAYAGGLDPSCLVAFALQTPHPLAAQGGAFGFTYSQNLPAPPAGVYYASVTMNGLVTALHPPALGPGVTNTVLAWGGPWTTGMLTVSVTNVAPQVFVLSGSDGRVNGLGSISLVSGAISSSNLSGSAPAAGWLNLNVPEPGAAGGFAAALGVLAVAHGLLRGRAGATAAARARRLARD